MADQVPSTTVSVSWDSALEFTCQAGKHEIGIDGTTYTAPSPMQLLGAAVAGCMAIDLVHIIQKTRRKLTALEARFTGERGAENPKCFRKMSLDFALTTDASPEQVERALQLSRDTYCSVWNTIKPDIELSVSYTIQAPE
jgi:putative redox protein